MSIIRLLSNFSRHFNFDILWRICRKLSPTDRRNLAWRLLQSETDEVTFRRNGTLWTAKTSNAFIMAPLFSHGHYQGDEINALLNWINSRNRLTPSRNVILDIGANIGTTTIPFAQKTGAHILAIEPVPENFQLLERNVAQNGLAHRITCIQKAVSQQPGILEMAVPLGNDGGAFVHGNKSTGHSAPSYDFDIRNVTQISVDTLANILNDCQISPREVAFVWCDVEGCEANVIETGAALWQEKVPIFLEISPSALKAQNCLQEFPGIIARYFDRFVASNELVRQSAAAEFRPISELSGVIADLLKTKDALTDVLLLPKGFRYH